MTQADHKYNEIDWSIYADRPHKVYGAGGSLIAEFNGHEELARYRASRAATCVNACAGLNPEVIPQVIKVCEHMMCDLIALSEMHQHGIKPFSVDTGKVALAAVKEGQD